MKRAICIFLLTIVSAQVYASRESKVLVANTDKLRDACNEAFHASTGHLDLEDDNEMRIFNEFLEIRKDCINGVRQLSNVHLDQTGSAATTSN